MVNSNRLTVTIDGDVDAYVRALGRANSETRQFSQSAGTSFTQLFGAVSLGNMASEGATVAAAMLGREMREAIGAASDLAESQSKLTQVFGDSAGGLREWASTASTSMGMSQQKAIEATASIGNFAQSLGLSRTEAVAMSPAVVQLAADLASFNNASPEETLLALRSGLSGEAEPLRRFGVALNAASVESAALELGLARTKDEITEGIKVQARYALIMDQTASAQGDFARTADGLANQQRTLNAQWDDMRAKIGEALLPAVLNLVDALNDLLEQHGDQWAKDFASAVDTATTAVALLSDKIGALNEGVTRLTGSGLWTWLKMGAEFAVPGLRTLESLLGSVGGMIDRAQLAESEGGRGAGMVDAEADPNAGGAWVPPKKVEGPRLGSTGGGGGGGAKADAFSAATLGLMDQILAGVPSFTPGALDANALNEFRAAEQEFASIRASVNRDLAELGLRMADLDARGQELSPEFKAMQDRADGLRSALKSVDLVEDLRLTPFRDAMEGVAEALDLAREAGNRLDQQSKQWFQSELQRLIGSGTRFSPGAWANYTQGAGFRPIGDFPAYQDGRQVNPAFDQAGNPIDVGTP